MNNISDSSPRIYVACLAAYNNGFLHGVWIDADQDAAQIRDEIAAMLGFSPVEDAEEYAIHDYESFEGVSISEYAGIDCVVRMAAFIAEHGALGAGLPEHGMATIWDADVLIWAASQIVAAENNGLTTSRFVRFTPYHLLRAIGRPTGNHQYRLLKAALARLQSTVIATTTRYASYD